MGEDIHSQLISATGDPAKQFKLNRDFLELIKPDGMAAAFQVLVQRKAGR
jgi:hypothetical protein